jgi:hypothetical protein
MILCGSSFKVPENLSNDLCVANPVIALNLFRPDHLPLLKADRRVPQVLSDAMLTVALK